MNKGDLCVKMFRKYFRFLKSSEETGKKEQEEKVNGGKIRK